MHYVSVVSIRVHAHSVLPSSPHILLLLTPSFLTLPPLTPSLQISSLKQDNARLKQQLKAAKRQTQAQQGLESVDGQPTPPLQAGDREFQGV